MPKDLRIVKKHEKKFIVTKWIFYFSPPDHKNFYGLRKIAFF